MTSYETREMPPAAGEMDKIPKGEFVYLGGTVGNNPWRGEFLDLLAAHDATLPSRAFNPVVLNWDANAKKNENKAKEEAAYHLYYITDPQSEETSGSHYSVNEAIARSFTYPSSTVIVFDPTLTSQGHSKKQLEAAKDILNTNPNFKLLLPDLSSAADWIAQRLLETPKVAKPMQEPELDMHDFTLADRWHAFRLKRQLTHRLHASRSDIATAELHEVGGKPSRRETIARYVATQLAQKRASAEYITNERDSNYVKVVR